MELSKAQEICNAVAAEAERWGKHAGFASYHPDDVQQALIACKEAGLFDLQGEREARVKANKNAGAAKARAVRAQKKVQELEKKIQDMQKVIDLQKKVIAESRA